MNFLPELSISKPQCILQLDLCDYTTFYSDNSHVFQSFFLNVDAEFLNTRLGSALKENIIMLIEVILEKSSTKFSHVILPTMFKKEYDKFFFKKPSCYYSIENKILEFMEKTNTSEIRLSVFENRNPNLEFNNLYFTEMLENTWNLLVKY